MLLLLLVVALFLLLLKFITLPFCAPRPISLFSPGLLREFLPNQVMSSTLIDRHRDPHPPRSLFLTAAGASSISATTASEPPPNLPQSKSPGRNPSGASTISTSLDVLPAMQQQHQNPLPATRNPSGSYANGSRSQNRLSSDMRNRGPLPVPSGPGAHLQNGHSRNMSGFEMAARSPPNPSSKSTASIHFLSAAHSASVTGPEH